LRLNKNKAFNFLGKKKHFLVFTRVNLKFLFFIFKKHLPIFQFKKPSTRNVFNLSGKLQIQKKSSRIKIKNYNHDNSFKNKSLLTTTRKPTLKKSSFLNKSNPKIVLEKK